MVKKKEEEEKRRRKKTHKKKRPRRETIPKKTPPLGTAHSAPRLARSAPPRPGLGLVGPGTPGPGPWSWWWWWPKRTFLTEPKSEKRNPARTSGLWICFWHVLPSFLWPVFLGCFWLARSTFGWFVGEPGGFWALLFLRVGFLWLSPSCCRWGNGHGVLGLSPLRVSGSQSRGT